MLAALLISMNSSNVKALVALLLLSPQLVAATARLPYSVHSGFYGTLRSPSVDVASDALLPLLLGTAHACPGGMQLCDYIAHH
jgi:hypothetical protein